MNQEPEVNNQPQPPAEQGQPQGPPRSQGFQLSIWKMIILYFVVNQIFGFFKQPNPKYTYKNVIGYGEPFTLKVVINTTKETPFEWIENDLFYDTQSTNFRTMNFTVTAEELRQNPYMTAFIYIDLQNTQKTLSARFPICDYRKKHKVETKNLMFNPQEEFGIKQIESNDTDQEKFLHFKSLAFINLIYDTSAYPVNQVPPQFIGKYIFQNDSDGLLYQPYVDSSNFRLRKKDYLLVEGEDVPADQEFSMQLEFTPYNYWKFLMTLSIQDSGKVYEQFGMENIMGDETTQDQLKEMIYDTNVYLLVLTFCVSMLHTVFSTLAIKNDIQYWRNLSSQQGISVRMLYTNFVIEIIITLYLFDNETSMLILVQSVIELGLMVWKILKTTKFKWRPDGKFPYVALDHNESYTSTTQEFDKSAAKYLYITLIPLFAGYLIYSLIYEEHKGWYSYLLTSCVGFIYVFGFINMMPQLYINYKLKSVAHLPWRMMIYKFLNTIIDDLFAFIITMPWLKRLSCFRDDIIFIIYIYQRRIYRVDRSRIDIGMNVDQNVNEQSKEGQNQPASEFIEQPQPVDVQPQPYSVDGQPEQKPKQD